MLRRWPNWLALGALAAALAMLLLWSASARAAGLLTPNGGGLPPLEILDHEVKVVIEDGYAVTTVEQVFHNPHGRDLEAIYSFPVPEKAAVAEFTYWIDGQPVSGEVLAKERARQVYEDQKAAGNETALAEQDSYKTFDISVWPVRAGRDVAIRLAYIQPAQVDTGVGRFVYPLEEGGVDEQKLAFWTANETVTGRFSFDLHLRSATPVEAVRLPAHPRATATKEPDGSWRIHLDNGVLTAAALPEEESEGVALRPAATTPAFRLDTDILVYWRHAVGQPASVDLVAHREPGARRGTFMLVVTPGEALKPIAQGGDWMFVLDKSGSMSGKWHTLVAGVEEGLQRLRPSDRFSIVLFDRTARDLTGGYLAATPENVTRAIGDLATLQPDNGTNLYAGLQQGLRRLDDDRTTSVLLVTDGVANVGETEQRAFLKLIGKQDIRLFTFIMGNSANRPLLQAMTRESGGTAVSVSNSDDVLGAVLNAVGKVTHEAMHGVEIEIDGVETADLAPARLGSLYRGQQLALFGHYRGEGPAEVTLKARISGRPVEYRTRFDFPAVARGNPEIERLWAFAAIEEYLQELEDFGADADLEQAVVGLGVEYGLVTPYTSMVVVREEVFQQLNIQRGNQARRAVEKAAAEQRASDPAQSRRVDQAAPMFQGQRPSLGGRSGGGSGGGAGSVGLFGLLMVLLLAALAWRTRGRLGPATR